MLINNYTKCKHNFQFLQRRVACTTAVQIRAQYFSVEERGQLEVNEKENMPLADRVAIVVEVYGAVCQLYLRLWNSALQKMQEYILLTSGGKS